MFTLDQLSALRFWLPESAHHSLLKLDFTSVDLSAIADGPPLFGRFPIAHTLTCGVRSFPSLELGLDLGICPALGAAHIPIPYFATLHTQGSIIH